MNKRRSVSVSSLRTPPLQRAATREQMDKWKKDFEKNRSSTPLLPQKLASAGKPAGPLMMPIPTVTIKRNLSKAFATNGNGSRQPIKTNSAELQLSAEEKTVIAVRKSTIIRMLYLSKMSEDSLKSMEQAGIAQLQHIQRQTQHLQRKLMMIRDQNIEMAAMIATMDVTGMTTNQLTMYLKAITAAAEEAAQIEKNVMECAKLKVVGLPKHHIKILHGK